jgi:cellulase
MFFRRYPAFNPISDRNYQTLKRIEWGWVGHSTAGVGPVLDVMSNDIACRANPIPAKLNAPIRAGGQITFKWTNYFTSHKGPLITWAGEYAPGQNINDVQWFKLAEDSYDPKTGILHP